ncbi:MAG: hypothetical protein JXM71_09320, partial [Spirochaetales bacterium]|nr:hypothetical protein [Spirochaetales bacterium]
TVILDSYYTTRTDAESGDRGMTGFVDAVAVYDVPMKTLVEVMLDYENHATFIPYFLRVSLKERNVAGDLVLYASGIRFLGFETSYTLLFNIRMEHLGNGAVGFRNTLAKSVDGKVLEHFTSYYFEPVVIHGKTMVFIRYFNRPGLRESAPGMVAVVSFFIPFATKGHLSALIKETQRRRGSE